MAFDAVDRMVGLCLIEVQSRLAKNNDALVMCAAAVPPRTPPGRPVDVVGVVVVVSCVVSTVVQALEQLSKARLLSGSVFLKCLLASKVMLVVWTYASVDYSRERLVRWPV